MVLHENMGRLNGHSASHSNRGRIILAAFVIGIAILLPSFFWRFFEETRQANLHQQQTLIVLQKLVNEVRKERAEITQTLESKPFSDNNNNDNDNTLNSTTKKIDQVLQQLESKINQLGLTSSQISLHNNNTTTTDNSSIDKSGKPPPLIRIMTDRIAGLPSAVVRIDQKGQYTASPSILTLPSGRLLVALEISLTWGQNADTLIKHIYASDDRGKSWKEIATIGPMNWPQLFACKSGTYIIGTERHFSNNNNLVISKMIMDSEGKQWSKPVRISNGLSVVAANTGVDVSNGRVTKTFEIIPSMAEPVPMTVVVDRVEVKIEGGVGGATWSAPPVYKVKVEDSSPFIEYCLIKIVFTTIRTTNSTNDDNKSESSTETKALFFRILGNTGPPSNELTLRLERFNLFFQTDSITIPPNSKLTTGSSSMVYGGVDWVASAINADENDDLTDPKAWTFLSPAMGNPASIYSNEFRELFDIAFRPDADVRKGILGFDLGGGIDQETAWEAGFGSLYWMEGVVVRQQDRHGSNGRLLSIMRVNNDLACDLAAVLEFDDSQPGRLVGRFLRYTFVPGLGVGHPAIVYDSETDLYWMATNVNRDSTRGWKQPDRPDGKAPSLHITLFSKCEVDRSTLGLFYSTNLFNWIPAGVVDYHTTLGRHFAYPHMAVDGEDLVIVSRATIVPGERESTLNDYYNNHNANAVSFHRVERFRELANVEWATYQGPYSAEKRRVAAASWNP